MQNGKMVKLFCHFDLMTVKKQGRDKTGFFSRFSASFQYIDYFYQVIIF
jgi:hypothetical protein